MAPTNAKVPDGKQNSVTSLPELIAAVDRLCEIIEIENSVLDRRSPSELAATQEEKLNLTDLYVKATREINAEPRLLETASATDRTRLKSAMQTFNDLMHAHARKLVTVKSVTESLFREIVQEVQKNEKPARGYGCRGSFNPVRNGAPGKSTALAVNQTV